MYESIEDAIVDFLIKYNLTDQYLKNLKSRKSCIGCTRDVGNHDGECPVFNKEFHGYKNCTTNQNYEEQLRDLYKYYLK